MSPSITDDLLSETRHALPRPRSNTAHPEPTTRTARLARGLPPLDRTPSDIVGRSRTEADRDE